MFYIENESKEENLLQFIELQTEMIKKAANKGNTAEIVGRTKRIGKAIAEYRNGTY